MVVEELQVFRFVTASVPSFRHLAPILASRLPIVISL